MPPAAPPQQAPYAPPQQYWAPQPVMPPPARRSGLNPLVILAIALAVIVVAVVAGGYLLLGSSYAAARVANADAALAGVQKIDFTTTLFDVGGGFDLTSSSFDPKTFQGRVNQFVQAIAADASTMSDDSTKLDAARKQLSNSAWLTALNRASLDAAATRLDGARQALSDGQSIAADMTKDGQFFTAYAAALVDFFNYVTQATAGNATQAISSVQQTKVDLGKALPLVGAPGLPSGVRDLITDFQALMSDIDNLINANLNGDKAGHDAALAQANKDGAALNKVDTSGFDGAVQDFYQSRIGRYSQELEKTAA